MEEVKPKNKTKVKGLDVLDSMLSLACAVHCLVFPFLVSLGSVFVLSEYTHELTEFFILSISVTICLWSLVRSYQSHRKNLPLTLLMVSIVTLVFARVFHSFLLELVLSTSGALLIASAHLLNRKLLRSPYVKNPINSIAYEI